LRLALCKLDVAEGEYVPAGDLTLMVRRQRCGCMCWGGRHRNCRCHHRRRRPCMCAQMSTSAATSEAFARQLAAMQAQLSASRSDVAAQSRLVSLMRALVVEASRSLYDLPRLETAVRGAQESDAALRAALREVEARHEEDVRRVKAEHEAAMAKMGADHRSAVWRLEDRIASVTKSMEAHVKAGLQATEGRVTAAAAAEADRRAMAAQARCMDELHRSEARHGADVARLEERLAAMDAALKARVTNAHRSSEAKRVAAIPPEAAERRQIRFPSLAAGGAATVPPLLWNRQVMAVASDIEMRRYPKADFMHATDDAGLVYGGKIPNRAIRASSQWSGRGGSREIWCPARMCRLGSPGVETDTISERTFAPANDDASAGGPWIQVSLTPPRSKLALACGVVMRGADNTNTGLRFCWPGTVFQVSLDGVTWTSVTGGDVSADGGDTWTPVGADAVWRRTAAMAAADDLWCRWDAAYRCRFVRAVLKERAAAGTASQMQWEVLRLREGTV